MTTVEFLRLVFFLVGGGLIGGVLADPRSFLHLKILAGVGALALWGMLISTLVQNSL